MRTDEEIIEDFRREYIDEFGEDISFDEAHERLMRLVKFLRVLLYPEIEQEDKTRIQD